MNTYGKKVDPKKYGIHGVKPLCLVKYNDQWHRGIINETKGDGKPECVLIDLLFTSKVKIEDVFQLPEVLARFPIMSEIYKIEGYNTNEEVKNYCNQMVYENGFIVAEKVEIKDDDPVIHIKMNSD